MKHLIVIGIFAWIFCTGLRYYSWSKYHEGSQASSLLTFLPKSRDDALLFAIQFASLLEILIGVLYGLFRLDLYISKPLVYGVISQLLCFLPPFISLLVSAFIVRIKKLN